jgi:uncharacterized protein with PQ loop repeat
MEILNQILGWVIIVGTFITYGFQYKKLYDNKDVDGINDNMLLLGCTSSLLNLLGIISSNIDDFNNGNLYFKLLPLIQLFAPWICLQINYHFYYMYETVVLKRSKYKLFNILLFLMTITIYPILVLCSKGYHDTLADMLNIMSGILSVAMWIPQILTTYSDKKAGSLSLISIGCHAIGCIMVIIFQLSEKENFSIVIPYIIALLCEGWIVCYCLLNRDNNIPLIDLEYSSIDSSIDDSEHHG